VSEWLQVDAFREQHTPHAPGVEWRAFARLESGSLRFRARSGDKRLKIERPCGFHPGKWRAAGFATTLTLVEHVRRSIEEAERLGKWHGGFSESQAAAVLVAFDQWQEAGCPRMSRPKVIP
jgi:hypothetical protein